VSRIDAVFQALKKTDRVALMPFLTAGDPSLDLTARYILEMEKNGADIIELGIPFSDPLADGPTIQRSAQRALAAGVSLAGILDFLKELRKESRIPIVLMGYFNPIFHYGVERFVEDAEAAGADGVIVPDLPPEEAGELMDAAKDKGLDMIFLLAPTSTPERIKIIAELSQGFIYYVSLTGVTGARSQLSTGIAESISKIRQVTSKPICVGFGISSPDHVRDVRHFVDGVIVGSAVVGRIEKVSGRVDGPEQVGGFIRELREATDRSG
jgi:tryptophan synthase alpha chain